MGVLHTNAVFQPLWTHQADRRWRWNSDATNVGDVNIFDGGVFRHWRGGRGVLSEGEDDE